MDNNKTLIKQFAAIKKQYAHTDLDFDPYLQSLKDTIHQIDSLKLLTIDCNYHNDTFAWTFTFEGNNIPAAINWLQDDNILPKVTNCYGYFKITFTL